MKALKQAEIAKQLGVSQATVSRCLRRDPSQSPATRERVLRFAKKLGYVPNTFASGLARSRIRDVGSLRANLAIISGNTFWDPAATLNNWGLFCKEARKHAQKLGYSLEYFWRYQPGMTTHRLRQMIDARGIRGVILLMISHEELDLPWEHLALSAACIASHRPARLHYVGSNEFDEACLALDVSANLGYRKPGLIIDYSARNQPYEGAMMGAFMLQQRRQPAKDRLPPYRPRADTPDYSHFMRWFNKYRPDVLFAHGGDFAATLKDRIPQEVGFVNLSGLDYGILQNCTYIGQRTDLAGVAAVDIVTGQLSRNELGWPEHPRCIIVPSQWVGGATTRSKALTSYKP